MSIYVSNSNYETDFGDFRAAGSKIPKIGFDELCDDPLK
jgi:hypothetical protein